MVPVIRLLPDLQKIVDVLNSTKQLTIYGLPTKEETNKKNPQEVLITENV